MSHKSAQTFSHAQQSFFLFAVSKQQSYKVQEMILAHNLMQHCTSRSSVSGLIITLQPKYLNCLKGIFNVQSCTDLIIQIFCKKFSCFLPFLPGLSFCSGLKVHLLTFLKHLCIYIKLFYIIRFCRFRTPRFFSKPGIPCLKNAKESSFLYNLDVCVCPLLWERWGLVFSELRTRWEVLIIEH